MADKKEEVKEVKKEVKGFAVSESAREKGYKATIDGKIIHIHAPVKTKFGQVIKESYIEVQKGFDSANGTPVMQEVEILDGLSDRQLYELVLAGVIALTPEQEKSFGEKFYKK